MGGAIMSGAHVSCGAELETWTCRRNGGHVLPMDSATVARLLRAYARERGTRSGTYAIEPGRGSLELCGAPDDSIAGAATAIKYLYNFACDLGLELVCAARAPYTVPRASDVVEPDNKTPRATVLWPAARQEVLQGGGTEADADCMRHWNDFAATHLHVWVDGMPISVEHVDYRVLFAMNVINLVAPFLAHILCGKYNVDNTGHLAINQRAAGPYRFTRFGDWYPTFDHLRAHFETISRLIRAVGESAGKTDTAYMIDLVSLNQWACAADHGMWWPFCRPRPHNGPGTMELRILPSVPIDCVEPILNDLLQFYLFLVMCAPADPLESVDALMSHPIWGRIVSFNIGGYGSLPNRISRDDWTRMLNR